MKRIGDDGFTLIEMMVALFIFAMIASAGVALLSFGVRAQAAATASLDESATVRRLSVLLAGDLAQATPRLARDVAGQTVRAFTGNDGQSDPLVMGYVRTGWTNPDGVRRAGVQRVDIVIDGDRLVRATYPNVDGSATTGAVTIADHVTGLAMRYREPGGDWRPRWDNAALTSLPVAVEMTVMRRGQAPLVLAWTTGTRYS